MLSWQRSNAFQHQRGLFAKLRCLIGQRIMAGQVLDVILKFVLVALGKRGKRRRAFLPHRIAVTIQENRTEPGEELAIAIVTPHAAPALDQGVLREFFGHARISA